MATVDANFKYATSTSILIFFVVQGIAHKDAGCLTYTLKQNVFNILPGRSSVRQQKILKEFLKSK